MSDSILLHELVETWTDVRSSPGRIDKRTRMAELFARLRPEDLRLAASWLAGLVPQGALQVGGRMVDSALNPERVDDLPLFAAGSTRSEHSSDSLHAAPSISAAPPRPLTLADVDAAFDRLQRIGGPGSEPRRVALLRELFARAGETGREFLSGLLLGELRQGALRAVVIEALAATHAVPAGALRRAIMLAGDFGAVVTAIATEGAAALERFGPQLLVPIEPMLAAPAASLAEAISELGGAAAVEWKLDGVRLQLHREGETVRAFSRALRDVTPLVPELVAWGRALPAASFILDGEVTSHGKDGRPIPFQDLMSRFSRESGSTPPNPTANAPLRAFWFDVLYLDGTSLLEHPYRERRAALEALLPETDRVPALVAEDPARAEAFYADALERGHEGVVVKALDAPYDAGRRGAQWRKVKPAVTLDLVILAAEWGHGRRQGWLSNLHLGARVASEPGRFVMLGKTFKGMTDAMLEEITTDLQALATDRDASVVHVRPERVVEIAFDAVQRSPRYDSGLALRFARVKRFRPDKSPAEATTLDEIRAIHARQNAHPG